MTNYKWNQVSKECDHGIASAVDGAVTVGAGVFSSLLCDVTAAMTLIYYNMRVSEWFWALIWRPVVSFAMRNGATEACHYLGAWTERGGCDAITAVVSSGTRGEARRRDGSQGRARTTGGADGSGGRVYDPARRKKKP